LFPWVSDGSILEDTKSSGNTEEYFAIATKSILLRNILPANHVWGIKYFRKSEFSIKLYDTAT